MNGYRMYYCERKDKNGFTERLWLHQRCKGWKVLEIRTFQ